MSNITNHQLLNIAISLLNPSIPAQKLTFSSPSSKLSFANSQFYPIAILLLPFCFPTTILIFILDTRFLLSMLCFQPITQSLAASTSVTASLFAYR